MKKTTKYIIITLAVLLALGGAFAALYFTDPARSGEESEASAPSGTSIALYERDKGEVSRVSVKNGKGAYTLVQTAEAKAPEEGSESEGTAYSYAFEGFEGYELNTLSLESMIGNVCALKANKDLGEVQSLGDYGLEGEEASVVTVVFTDGSQETFTAGIKGGETAGNYILYNGRVYIGYVSDPVFADKYDYFTSFSYNAADLDPESGEQLSAPLYSLKLEGSNFPVPITLGYDEQAGEYRMTAPINSSANITYMETLVTAMQSMSSTVVLANATEADLEEYGLKAPFATASFTVGEQRHTISVSERKVDGNRYMLVNGDASTIYAVKAEDVAAWAESNVTKLRSSYVFLPAVVTVDEFTIEAGGKTTVVDLSRTVNEEKSSDTQTTYDYTAKLDGREIDYETIPKFYSSMISIAVLNTEELPHEEEAELTLTFKYYEGGQDVLTYHRATEDRLVAKLNGAYSATVRNSNITDFLTTLERFSAQ